MDRIHKELEFIKKYLVWIELNRAILVGKYGQVEDSNSHSNMLLVAVGDTGDGLKVLEYKSLARVFDWIKIYSSAEEKIVSDFCKLVEDKYTNRPIVITFLGTFGDSRDKSFLQLDRFIKVINSSGKAGETQACEEFKLWVSKFLGKRGFHRFFDDNTCPFSLTKYAVEFSEKCVTQQIIKDFIEHGLGYACQKIMIVAILAADTVDVAKIAVTVADKGVLIYPITDATQFLQAKIKDLRDEEFIIVQFQGRYVLTKKGRKVYPTIICEYK